MAGNDECSDGDDPRLDSDMVSDSDALSDIFETDSDTETEEKAKRPLYLNEFEKFPVESDGESKDFKMHMHQISTDSKKAESLGKDTELPDLDEVDRMFLRAASLLKKKKG
ncbi:hypothetical protein L1049_000076 [Liquidambar formosana]|uniref:Uncharacterized protein n=1 Tax=Liquidambar formosana TaxID=63359 RepID=A0AAP0N940_LIQFO